MLTLVVVLAVLLLITALIIDEKQINIYRPMGQAVTNSLIWLGDHNAFGQVVKKGIEIRKKEQEAQALKEYKEYVMEQFKKVGLKIEGVYGGDYEWSPVAVHIKPDQLHEARRVMRLIVGSWNDQIIPGACDEDWSTKKHMLSVSYEPKEEMRFKTVIKTKYDIDDLPKGLLKEGCEVIREHKVTVSCSVRCAA